MKVLISCASTCSVNFLSRCYGGWTSDIQIVIESVYIGSRFHQPGYQILEDCGFSLKDDFTTECNAELVMPAFTRGKPQLTGEERKLRSQEQYLMFAYILSG